MALRLIHAIFGHSFFVGSFCYLPGTGKLSDESFSGEARQDIVNRICYGQTQFILFCRCGEVKQFRVLGRHEIKKERGTANASPKSFDDPPEAKH